MAQHGGNPSLPRAHHHRPRAPIMSIPVPLTAPLPPLRPPPVDPSATASRTTTTSVSLVAPRPENERSTNEYVETPFRATVPPLLPPLSPLPQPPRTHRARPPPPPPPHHHLPPLPLSAAITKQPQQQSFVKEPTSGGECLGGATARPSIMCAECGRCRCDACQRPRPLPQKWVCNDGCLLSADSIIDYASCLCCVKALFYHCSESEGGESCADEPCGCAPDRRVARWGCLASLGCVLPCLWLYWPLRGAKKLVEECYARHTRPGCRCRPSPLPTPEKRLLDSNSDF